MTRVMLPLALATLLYLWTAIEFYRKADSGMTIVWISYALANSGYVLHAIQTHR